MEWGEKGGGDISRVRYSLWSGGGGEGGLMVDIYGNIWVWAMCHDFGVLEKGMCGRFFGGGRLGAKGKEYVGELL